MHASEPVNARMPVSVIEQTCSYPCPYPCPYRKISLYLPLALPVPLPSSWKPDLGFVVYGRGGIQSRILQSEGASKDCNNDRIERPCSLRDALERKDWSSEGGKASGESPQQKLTIWPPNNPRSHIIINITIATLIIIIIIITIPHLPPPPPPSHPNPTPSPLPPTSLPHPHPLPHVAKRHKFLSHIFEDRAIECLRLRLLCLEIPLLGLGCRLPPRSGCEEQQPRPPPLRRRRRRPHQRRLGVDRRKRDPPTTFSLRGFARLHFRSRLPRRSRVNPPARLQDPPVRLARR